MFVLEADGTELVIELAPTGTEGYNGLRRDATGIQLDGMQEEERGVPRSLVLDGRGLGDHRRVDAELMDSTVAVANDGGLYSQG